MVLQYRRHTIENFTKPSQEKSVKFGSRDHAAHMLSTERFFVDKKVFEGSELHLEQNFPLNGAKNSI